MRIICFIVFSFFHFQVKAQIDTATIDTCYMLLSEGEMIRAKSKLDSLYGIDPNDADLNNALGVFFRKNQLLDTAIQHFEISLRADTTLAQPLLNLAYINTKKEDYVAVLEYGYRYCNLKENVQGFRLLGDTYSVLEMYDSALVYYNKAAKVDSTLADLYFDMAQIYWYQYADQAMAYRNVTKSIVLDSTVNYFYALRAQMLLDDYPIESLKDLNRAIESGDTSIQNYVYRSWACAQIGDFESSKKDFVFFEGKEEYTYWFSLINAEIAYQEQDYSKCIEFCNKALIIYPDDNYVLAQKARAYVFSGKLEVADRMLSQMTEINSRPSFELLTLHAYVRLLKNTPADEIEKDEHNFYFKEISADHFQDLVKLSKTARWSYEALVKKFENDYQRLSLQEYFMLYFGYSNTNEYSAFELTQMQEETLWGAVREGLYSECIEVGIETLKKNPTQFPLYLPIAKAAWLSGDIEMAEKYAYLSEAFYNSILATGKGNKAKSAIIVISESHEYALLKYMGLQSLSHKLVKENKHAYDHLITYDRARKQNELFFLIDKVFESYGKMLKDE